MQGMDKKYKSMWNYAKKGVYYYKAVWEKIPF